MSSYKVFVQGQKDYRVNLDKSPINITVKKSKNLVEAKAYIDGLIEHSKFTFSDSLTILATLTELGVTQIIVGSSDLAILSSLSGLVKTATISAEAELGIDASMALTTSYDAASFFNIGIDEAADFIAHILFDANDVLGVDTNFTFTPTVYICLIGESRLGIGMEISGMEITSNLSAEDEIGIGGESQFDYLVPYECEFEFGVDGHIDIAAYIPVDGNNDIYISADAIDFLARKYFSANGELSIESVIAFVNTMFGEMDGSVDLGIDGRGTFSKGVNFDMDSDIGVTGSVEFVGAIPINGSDSIGIDIDTDDPVITSQLTAQDALTINASTSMVSEDLFTASDSTSISVGGGYVSNDLIAGSISFTIDASADFTMAIIRLRLLSDMDDFDLSDFDSMTLGQLTYIIDD